MMNQFLKLEKTDEQKYIINVAKFELDYNAKTNRCNYCLRLSIDRLTEEDIIWYSRFDEGLKVEFLGAEIFSSKETRIETKYDNSKSLEEIKLFIPGALITEKVDVVIRYSKKLTLKVISSEGLCKTVLIGWFNSFAAFCKELIIEFELNPEMENLFVLTPANCVIDESLVMIKRSNLSPQQFVPVTILGDLGQLKRRRFINKYKNHFIGAVIGAVVSGIFALVFKIIEL